MKATLNKPISIILVAICIVGLFGFGISFADSFPTYTTSGCTVTFSDAEFVLTSNSSTSWLTFRDCNSASGSGSVSVNGNATSNDFVISFPVKDSTTVVTFSNLVGCSERNGALFFDSGTSFASFDFDITTSNPEFNTGQLRFYVPAQRTATYSFTSFDFNGESIVSGLIGEVLDFAIQPGYAVVIDGDFDIVERSYYINNSWNFTSNSNHRVNGSIEKKLSSSYIVDGFSPDRVHDPNNLIQWEALNTNLLGAASNYEFYDGTLLPVDGAGWSYIICYPQLYGFGNANTRQMYTNSVDMVCSLYIEYTVRPTIRFVAIESLSEYDSFGDFYTYSVFRPSVANEEGVSSGGSGGTVVTPENPLPSGGGNAGQPPVDEDGSLLGTISRFVNDIKRLLSSAVDAINTLVSQGSSFMQSIGAMFGWLPAPLITLIIAGFTILLVVGVLKVLWR